MTEREKMLAGQLSGTGLVRIVCQAAASGCYLAKPEGRKQSKQEKRLRKRSALAG